MRIFLAGGITGNNNHIWKSAARGGADATILGWQSFIEADASNHRNRGGHRILESFFYIKDNQWISQIIPFLDDFLLDSGAYSFMQGMGVESFDQYVEDYIAFINRNNVKKFVELDCDAVIPLSKIGRVVDWCAARLQIQERLVADVVKEISDALGEENPPLGIALYMEGEHLCKTMRGAKKEGTMSCCHLTGIFREDGQARAEFLATCKETR